MTWLSEMTGVGAGLLLVAATCAVGLGRSPVSAAAFLAIGPALAGASLLANATQTALPAAGVLIALASTAITLLLSGQDGVPALPALLAISVLACSWTALGSLMGRWTEMETAGAAAIFASLAFLPIALSPALFASDASTWVTVSLWLSPLVTAASVLGTDILVTPWFYQNTAFPDQAYTLIEPVNAVALWSLTALALWAWYGWLKRPRKPLSQE